MMQAQELIEIWRPPESAQVELRRGRAVAGPVPRHWHEEYQLCLIQNGAGELCYRGGTHPTPPASLFIVQPGEVHANRSFDRQGCSYRAMYLETGLLRSAAADLRGRQAALPYFPETVLYDAVVLGKYLDWYGTLEQPAAPLEREAGWLELAAELLTRFAETPLPPRPAGREQRAVNLAREYLTAHFADNVALATLARLVQLSPFHFHRVFTEQTGMPPHAFQTQLRVLRAKTLLRQGVSAAQAAVQVGFFDQSHLHRHFKRLVGVAPNQYRLNRKNVQDPPPATH